MRISLLAFLLFFGATLPAHALSPVACTMDAKLCPDGTTYVGRDGNRNCQWQLCPGEMDTCTPYLCHDGTRVDKCALDGTVINYFAAPCLTHGGEVDTSQAFSDVPPTHPNAEAIAYLKNAGVIEGYPPEYYFYPDQKINRAEFVKVLTVGLNLNQNAPTPLGTCTTEEIFPDISRLSWYVSFTCTARRLGFIHGYPDGLFHGDRSINFVETAKILSKAFSLPAQSNETTWYKDYVQALAKMNAIPLSIISFDQSITRGDMAEMIFRLKSGNSNKPSRAYEDVVRSERTFDGCGTVTSYNNQPWFKDFSSQTLAHGMSTEVSAGFSKGCLASDGSQFLAIWSGGYCDGSRFLVYSTSTHTLDTAGIFWKDVNECSHIIDDFGARNGTHITLTGLRADAGCSTMYYYDYDLVSNVITKTKMQSWCQGQSPTWQYYND